MGVRNRRKAITEALTSQHATYLVRLGKMFILDTDALITFLQWMRGRRAEGANVLLCAMQPQVFRAIQATGEADGLLVPFERHEVETPRSLIHADCDPLT